MRMTLLRCGVTLLSLTALSLSIVDHRRQKWLRCAGRPPDPARFTRSPARVLVLSFSSARAYRRRPCGLSGYSPMLIEVDRLSVIVHCAALEASRNAPTRHAR